jgi:hypothetical protein
MFLGCTPCCSVCPNYYDILDSADVIEMRPLVYFDDGTGTSTRFELFGNTMTGIGPSQGVDLSAINPSWSGTGIGGSVLFKPHNKVKNNNGLVMLRAYDPSGDSSSGSNWYEVAATPYSLTVTVNVRTESSFHRWYIQEHKCTLPNTYIYTEDGFDQQAVANNVDFEQKFVPFNSGEGWQNYRVSKGACQFLIFGSFDSYENPPVPEDLPAGSTPAYDGARNGLFLQDWSFIYPMASSHERQVWQQNNKSQVGTRIRGLVSGTSFPIRDWYRTASLSNDENTESVLDTWSSLPLSYFRGDWDMSGSTGNSNDNGWTFFNPIGDQGNDASMQVAMCARPYEPNSLADSIGIQQTRSLERNHWNQTRSIGAAGTQDTFEFDVLWAWADGQRIDLMKTQPSVADPNTHWQSLGTMAADMEYDLFKVLRAFGYYHPSTLPVSLVGSCVGMGPADWPE